MDSTGVPCYQLGRSPMLPDTALAVVRDELILDGNARQNLATFCTSWMEPQARELMAECIDATRRVARDSQSPATSAPPTIERPRRCAS